MQQFHHHTMGCALPVGHIYLGVLLNCDAKKNYISKPRTKLPHITWEENWLGKHEFTHTK